MDLENSTAASIRPTDVMGFQLSGRQQNGLDLGMQRNATGAVHEDESQGTASEREMLQTIADPP